MLQFLLFLFCLIFQTFGNPSCPAGTTPSQHSKDVCFLPIQSPSTFTEAERICVARGGHLVPVYDQFTNSELGYVANSAFPGYSDFWVGGQLTDLDSSMAWLWKWFDSVIRYNDWAPGEPSVGRNCISVSISKAWWTANDCNVAKPFICRVPAQNFYCDDGWAYLEDTKMCYKMFSSMNGFDFNGAGELCSSHNSHIVSIHSDAENTMVGQLTTFGTQLDWPIVGVWIGLNYDGSFSWTDGTPYNYQAWGDDDPNKLDSQDCVNFYADGTSNGEYRTYIMKWDTSSCGSTLKRTVCKKQANTVAVFQNPQVSKI
uniref:C-type lectin domain-containing protein n=1 Tax=Panagrolaimus sp. JU765 TaxID=591449 RepID=A0AC34RD39_9BILA